MTKCKGNSVKNRYFPVHVLGRTVYLYTKINSKLISDLNVKLKVTTHRRKQEKFCDSELDKDFLDVTPKAQFINVKLINWAVKFYKLVIFKRHC